MTRRLFQLLRLTGFGIASVALVLVLVLPGRVAISERLDPVMRAESLISEGRYGEALKRLSRFEPQGLDDWDLRRILLQRAVCQKQLGRYGEALAGLQAVGIHFRILEDYLTFWQGECFKGLGRQDSAAACYSRVLRTRPASMLRDNAALVAAELHLAQGRPTEAAGLYRGLLGVSEREPDALVGLAAALHTAADSAGVRRTAMRLVRDYPEDPRAMEALKQLEPLNLPRECFYGGVAYARNGHFGRAITLFRRIIRRSPDATWRGRAQYELALAYYDQEHYRTAQRAFEKAYRTYWVPKALFDLGRCSVKLRRDLEAAKRFETFARLYPSVSGAAESLWNAGMAYERRGKYREAREVFLRLASRYPDSAFADQGVWRAGFALYKMGRYEAAARAFLRMAENTSEVHLRDQGYYWAGKCSRQLGRDEEADSWVRRAVEGFPTTYYSSRARAVLGRESGSHPFVRERNGNSAREEYHPSAGAQKGDLLARLGLYRLAEQEYQREERLNRTNLSALGDLLQRYERVGAMNRALRVSNLMLTLELERGIRLSVSSFSRLYPTYYSGEVHRTAQQLNLDPNLILAIIRQESAFDEKARSSAGAMGLMQVMPATGRTIARKIRMRGFSVDDLWEPQVSIRFGARHLSDHLRFFDRYDGRRLGLALAAYNAGLAVARRWSRYLPDGDVDEFVESIPYRETRNYVKLVYRNYQVYSCLHGEEIPPAKELMR